MSWYESEAKAECLDLRLRVKELEAENAELCKLTKGVTSALSAEIARLRDEVRDLRKLVSQEEMFCRASGDTDRADELKAALKGTED